MKIKYCDNCDCVNRNPKDIKCVKMNKEFEGEFVNWCEDCIKRDSDFIDKKRKFKYKVGDAIVNRWNWHYVIIGRYRNERGTNCYKVENNEDDLCKSDDDEDPIWKEGWVGVQKEWEIRRLD